MALSVLNVGQYPADGTSVDGSAFTFSSGVSTTNAGSYVAGYMDAENRAKFFYTDGASIPLPTLVQVTQISQVDSAGNTKTGAYSIQLSYSPLSPDATSANSEIYVDQSALIIKASTQYG